MLRDPSSSAVGGYGGLWGDPARAAMTRRAAMLALIVVITILRMIIRTIIRMIIITIIRMILMMIIVITVIGYHEKHGTE